MMIVIIINALYLLQNAQPDYMDLTVQKTAVRLVGTPQNVTK